MQAAVGQGPQSVHGRVCDRVRGELFHDLPQPGPGNGNRVAPKCNLIAPLYNYFAPLYNHFTPKWNHTDPSLTGQIVVPVRE